MSGPGARRVDAGVAAVRKVAVRSEALAAVAGRLDDVAGSLRDDAYTLTRALAAAPTESPWSGLGDPGRWAAGGSAVDARSEVLRLVGPTGLWGRAVDLDLLASRLRIAARTYEQVERAADALLAGVSAGVDLVGLAGSLTAHDDLPAVRAVEPTVSISALGGSADLVALGAGVDGGRVRVLEVETGDGTSGWVVVVSGDQEWGVRTGGNPFDAAMDVRALTGDATRAAAGVAAALQTARARSGRSVAEDPVLLAGHSQGGVLAAALATDPHFTEQHRVTHVVTTGSPVGVFRVPEQVRVLSVEHVDDPVPALDLTPNPARAGWLTLRSGPDDAPSLDVARHDREAYRATLAAASGAPRGAVSGLSGWEASAGDFLGRTVLSLTEVEVARSEASAGVDLGT
ncbi:MAG: hypothetical protein ACRCYX_14485 [Dermatophilaceae bacterium]